MFRSPDHAGPNTSVTADPHNAVHHTDQDTANLHANVTDQLAAAGHSVQTTVPAHELPVLSDIGEAIGASTYSAFKDAETVFGGETPDTFNRKTAGRNWRDKLRERMIRIKNSIKLKK